MTNYCDDEGVYDDSDTQIDQDGTTNTEENDSGMCLLNSIVLSLNEGLSSVIGCEAQIDSELLLDCAACWDPKDKNCSGWNSRYKHKLTAEEQFRFDMPISKNYYTPILEFDKDGLPTHIWKLKNTTESLDDVEFNSFPSTRLYEKSIAVQMFLAWLLNSSTRLNPQPGDNPKVIKYISPFLSLPIFCAYRGKQTQSGKSSATGQFFNPSRSPAGEALRRVCELTCQIEASLLITVRNTTFDAQSQTYQDLVDMLRQNQLPVVIGVNQYFFEPSAMDDSESNNPDDQMLVPLDPIPDDVPPAAHAFSLIGYDCVDNDIIFIFQDSYSHGTEPNTRRGILKHKIPKSALSNKIYPFFQIGCSPFGENSEFLKIISVTFGEIKAFDSFEKICEYIESCCPTPTPTKTPTPTPTPTPVVTPTPSATSPYFAPLVFANIP